MEIDVLYERGGFWIDGDGDVRREVVDHMGVSPAKQNMHCTPTTAETNDKWHA